MDRSHYAVAANLFFYPEADFVDRIVEVQAQLDSRYPEAAKELQPFTAQVSTFTLAEIQELFTRSFDVQSLTTLDIGYVLFGDDYKRGEMLSNLCREFNRLGIDCGYELADHLPNLLKLMACLEEGELLEELVSQVLIPAIAHMIGEFNPQRITLKNDLYRKHYKTLLATHDREATIYRRTLTALSLVLQQDFGIYPSTTNKTPNDFLRSIDAELNIERTSGS